MDRNQGWSNDENPVMVAGSVFASSSSVSSASYEPMSMSRANAIYCDEINVGPPKIYVHEPQSKNVNSSIKRSALGDISNRSMFMQTKSTNKSATSVSSDPVFGESIGDHQPPVSVATLVMNSLCDRISNLDVTETVNFPLKANTSELVWECVGLGTTIEKSLIVRNAGEEQLNLSIELEGRGFQMKSPDESFVLKGGDHQTICIGFYPTAIGEAIGKLIFKPNNSNEEVERLVYLWAYGGSTLMKLNGINRSPSGQAFLKMGETYNYITSTTTFMRVFTIYNNGPLNGVAAIRLKPQKRRSICENHIIVEPSKCTIQPNSAIDISVSYKPLRMDLDKINEASSGVLTVGTLEVICGSEPNRQRIAAMLTRYEQIPTMYKSLEFLVTSDFPVVSAEDFPKYRERVNNMTDLFESFVKTEIALTMDKNGMAIVDRVKLN